MGPYRFDIKKTDSGWEAEIYYDGKLIDFQFYELNYSAFVDGVDYTGNPKKGIQAELKFKAQTLGFYSTITKEYYPSLDELGITDENINPLNIDFSAILNLLGISLPDISIPQIPTSGSFELPKPPEIPKKLKLIPVKGIIVDITTNEPIKGVRILSPLKKPTKTNAQGEFELKVPDILNTPLNPKKFEINVLGKKGKYASTKITPYTSTNDVKTDLGIITLQPLESNLAKEITELLTFKDAEVEKYATTEITFEFFQQKQLNLSISELKKLVIPLILGLVAQYGLTKIQELIAEVEANGGELTESIKQQISCPSLEALTKIISTKNKLVHQLNNVLNKITSVTQTIQIADGVIQTIDAAYQVLKVLPTPTAVGGVGIPISVINTVQDVKTFLNNNIGKIKQGSSALATILGLLVEILSQVLLFLNFLDKITQFCSEGEINQAQISAELTALTTQQSNQLSPVVTNVNGFEMGVETENTTKPLKRRRAIARNKQGVVMLQGEWSFSSIDQILIDELVFYIQQNNLKAE
jgi:hypothetical protein